MARQNITEKQKQVLAEYLNERKAIVEMLEVRKEPEKTIIHNKAILDGVLKAIELIGCDWKLDENGYHIYG